MNKQVETKQQPDQLSTNSDLEQGRINSSELLGNNRRIIIEHEGSDYLLQVTRQGKLILTK